MLKNGYANEVFLTLIGKELVEHPSVFRLFLFFWLKLLFKIGRDACH